MLNSKPGIFCGNTDCLKNVQCYCCCEDEEIKLDGRGKCRSIDHSTAERIINGEKKAA